MRPEQSDNVSEGHSPGRSLPSRHAPHGSLAPLALVLLAFSALALVWLFERLPLEGTSLGLDWYNIWSGMNKGRPLYGSWMGTPPWILVLLLPLAFLSFRLSWGLIVLLTIGAVVLSLPRTSSRAGFVLMAFLVGTSFTNLRHAADGNLEGLVILGVLVSLWAVSRTHPYALAAGLILASAKVQVTWLFLIYTTVVVLLQWPRRRWLISAGLVAAFVGPCLIWKGSEWLQTLWVVRDLSEAVNVSLWATVPRLGLHPLLAVPLAAIILILTLAAVRTVDGSMTREKAGLLITASLLLAPYAAGNSLLSALALGALPLLPATPVLGGSLFLLDDLKYLSPRSWMIAWGSAFATGQIVLLWACLVWRMLRPGKAAIPTVRPSPGGDAL